MKSIYASLMTKQEIWTDFIAHFQSATSKASYCTDIEEIMNYFQKDFLLISASEIQEYFAYLEHKVKKGEMKPGTMAKKFRELHSFAEFICDNRDKYKVGDVFQDEYYPYLKLVAKQEKFVRTIPIEHIDRLLQEAQENLMEYCILVLLYRAGLASTEIVDLKVENIGEYDNGVFAYSEKRKQACYIPEDAVQVLKEYLAIRENQEYLFYNKRGNPLNTMYISRMMKKYTTRANLPMYSAENLRNACGMTLFAYGAEGRQVAAQLGISQVQIQRYQNVRYKDDLQKSGNSLVKLKVDLPNASAERN